MIASHLQIASLVNDRSHEMFASSSSKILEGKRHEMFKSRLQSRHWPSANGATVQSIAVMRS